MPHFDQADGFLLASVLADDTSASELLATPLQAKIAERKARLDAMSSAQKKAEISRIIALITGHTDPSRGRAPNLVRALAAARRAQGVT